MQTEAQRKRKFKENDIDPELQTPEGNGKKLLTNFLAIVFFLWLTNSFAFLLI